MQFRLRYESVWDRSPGIARNMRWKGAPEEFWLDDDGLRAVHVDDCATVSSGTRRIAPFGSCSTKNRPSQGVHRGSVVVGFSPLFVECLAQRLHATQDPVATPASRPVPESSSQTCQHTAKRLGIERTGDTHPMTIA